MGSPAEPIVNWDKKPETAPEAEILDKAGLGAIDAAKPVETVVTAVTEVKGAGAAGVAPQVEVEPIRIGKPAAAAADIKPTL